jgi:hypothetical protein
MIGNPAIGVPGQPWGANEREQWRALQTRRRSYDDDVVARVGMLRHDLETITYGRIEYGQDAYDLCALRSRDADPALPVVLVTGGVHGYETSGVEGALAFVEQYADVYAGRICLLVVPCVSPWAYERIHRWNFDAIDPNRSFRGNGLAREANALLDLTRAASGNYLMHIDLHETTNSDNTQFGPELSARKGEVFTACNIPDGFYVVADRQDPQLGFQNAIISAVEQVTHIAAPDARGEIFGSPAIGRGVVIYDSIRLGLCMGVTAAPFRTTTEVYPDSDRTTPDICVQAQIVAVCSALNFALAATN